MICLHCQRERRYKARGLCHTCWVHHRDAYSVLQAAKSTAVVCDCGDRVLEPVGGIWGALGAVACMNCARPPLEVLR